MRPSGVNPHSGAGRSAAAGRPRAPRWPLFLALLWPGTVGADPSRIAGLLDSAEEAERRGQLVYPARGSAMDLYHEVLSLEPGNAPALEGLARLAEHHLVAAQAALEEGQLLKADSLVSKARMIHPHYPPVATLKAEIERVRNAQRTRRTLDWRLVARRSERLGPTLRQLGGTAKSGDCRVTIQVSNDAEGRWVYQQMNRASGSGRIRASIRIASPAAVDVLCFAATEGEEGRHAG